MHIRTKFFIVFSAAFLWGGLFSAPSALAADAICLVPMIPNDMIFVPGAPVVNQQVKVYVTINPNCDQDVDGAIEFFANDVSLGSTPFSYKASGRTEEVWMSWTPKASGVTVIKATLSSPGWSGGTLSQEIYVDGDNDNDGIGDLLDPDDDNDGLADVDEIKLETNLLNPDTDGDGVNDKEDAFPLDPKKTQLDPPPAPSTPSVPAAPAAPAAQPPASLVHAPTPPVRSTAESKLNRESSTAPAQATHDTPNLTADNIVGQSATGEALATSSTDTEYLVVSTAPGSFSNSSSNQAAGPKSAPAKKGWGSAGMLWGVVILFAVMAVAFEVKHRTKKYN